ncbi:MAG: gas vesicle protein [Deltaproteobacteria bacterium]|nr:gas vesicle protein [Deltaproteobacteria bacterium]
MQGGQIIHGTQATNLADILERVLDKGVVIAGDVRIKLLDIELLTLQLRLVIASVDKAKEMGIDWWQLDPFLSSRVRENGKGREDFEAIKQRIEQLEACQTRRDGRKKRSRKRV